MKNISDMLHLVKDAQVKEKLLLIHEKYKQDLDEMPATLRMNHAYVGGLRDFIQQTMAVSIALFENLKDFNLGCTLDDVILVSFASGLDRLSRFQNVGTKEAPNFQDREDWMVSPRMRIIRLMMESGLPLTELQMHCISFMNDDFVESEAQYLGKRPQITPLTALLRAALLVSTKCMFNPKEPL